MRSRVAFFPVSFLLVLSLTGCSVSLYDAIGNKINAPQLQIAPSTVTLKFADTITFSASGGVPPYAFTIVTGAGTVASATGQFTAPSFPGTTIIRVTDKKGTTADGKITITPNTGLVLTPSSATVNSGGTLTFVATGGTPPYTFSILSAGSAPPAPTISATGVYTAGSAIGSDTLQVTDATSATATASVSVTNAVTNVDYTVTGGTFPTTGTGATPISGGPYTFILRNIGSANGTKPVSWTVLLSSSSTLGNGATILASGTAAAVSASSQQSVPAGGLSWTWPTVSTTTTMYLFVRVSADDDLNQTNNTFSVPTPVTLTPPSVNYSVTSVAMPTGSTAPGGLLNGTFDIQNSGPGNGTQNASWQVYASTTPVPTLIASGSTGPLASGGTRTGIPFSGNWPLTYGYYFLNVKLTVTGDNNTNPNPIGATPGVTAVGIYALTEPNEPIASAFNTGITLQPGMSISVTGQINSALDATDFVQFNTAGVSNVTFSATWPASADVTLEAFDLSGISLGTATATGTSVSLTVSGAGLPRYINVVGNGPSSFPGTYTLIITAN